MTCASISALRVLPERIALKGLSNMSQRLFVGPLRGYYIMRAKTKPINGVSHIESLHAVLQIALAGILLLP